MKTNKDLIFTLGRMKYQVPEGSQIEFREGVYWINPNTFPVNSIARHDATHYGFRVERKHINFQKTKREVKNETQG